MMLLEQRTVELSAAVSPKRCAGRFLFYSHDGFGLGHTRRHLAVAHALTVRAFEFKRAPRTRRIANPEFCHQLTIMMGKDMTMDAPSFLPTPALFSLDG